MTYDSRLRRVSIFDRNGTLGRDFILETQGPYSISSATPFANGSFLVVASNSSPGQMRQSGIHRNPAIYFRYSSQGEPIDSLTVIPGREFLVIASEDRMLFYMKLPYATSLSAPFTTIKYISEPVTNSKLRFFL